MSRAFGHARRWGWDMRGQKGRLSYLSSDAPMYLQTNALWAQCGSGACKIVSKEFAPYEYSYRYLLKLVEITLHNKK